MTTQEHFEQLFYKVSEKILGFDPSASLDELCEQITEAAISLIEAERGFLYLKKEPSFSLKQIKIGEVKNLLNNVAKDGTAISTTAVIEGKPRSIVCSPLRIGREIIGSLFVDCPKDNKEFEEKHLKIMEFFSSQTAGIIESSIFNTKLLTVTKEVESLSEIIESQISDQELELEKMRVELGEKYQFKNIIGHSLEMQKILPLIEQGIRSNASILIHGEPGSGKKLIGKVIHYSGTRKEAPFVVGNCSAISQIEIERELFGEAGKIGLFEVANGGTLFLERVESLTLGIQRKLFQVIKEGNLKPLGGSKLIKINVRLVSATSANLKEMVEEGSFLEELYEHLRGISIDVPALRFRSDDVPFFVEHFLQLISEEQGVKQKQVSEEALTILSSYNWPGNVSQLENEIRKTFIRSGETIEPDDLSEEVKSPETRPGVISMAAFEGKTLHDAVDLIEQEMVRVTLDKTRGNKAKTAKILGISRTTLYEKIGKLSSEKKSA